MQSYPKTSLALILILAGLVRVPAQAADAVDHGLTVELQPAQGLVRGVDRITMPEDSDGVLELELHAAFELVARQGELALLGEGSRTAQVAVKRYRLTAEPGQTVELRYQGAPPSDDPQSEAAVFVLDAEEAYLDPEGAWYPQPVGRAATFTLDARLPAGWRLVSEGRRYRSANGAGTQWVAREPVPGIHLVAGPFVEYQRLGPSGEALVYLRAADEALARRYLDATVRYLELYSRLIGPYPFAKFALVENSRQTGFGMPSFTLLGSRVIRLPFIVHTSYPHEIVHSWWGNGVWVDYDSGNWAEGLTTYLADHLLAARQGGGAEYRRAVLQKYADFVAQASDFPVRQFASRHGEVSQAVGYGKTMMFFHMLRRLLGDAHFVQGLRRFYAEHRFQSASFDDLRASFEAQSGVDLEGFFEQWLDRAGAPQLHLSSVDVEQTDDGYRLRGVLAQMQGGTPYRLAVPLAIQVRDRPQAVETVVETDSERTSFEVLLPEQPQRVAVDARFDLFRRLSDAELPVSLGQLFAAERRMFIVPGEGALSDAYRSFAEALARPGDTVVSDREVRALPWEGAVWILGWDNRYRTTAAGALRGMDVRLTSRAAEVAGADYRAEDTSVVLAAAADQRVLGWVGASSAQAIQNLTRKLPHYSRYGYLAFRGDEAQNVGKGEWGLEDSPANQPLVHRAPALQLAPRPSLTAVVE